MPEIQGINTREVFDHYLSTVTPTIYNRGKGDTWVICLDYKDGSGNAETHVTDILCERNDTYDCEKLKKCFEWIKSVRDKYSIPNIEEAKPEIAAMRLLNDDLHRVKTEYVAEHGHLSVEQGKIISAQYELDLKALAEVS